MTESKDVRAGLVDAFRRDLIGPYTTPSQPQLDQDLADERLSEEPSRWYLTGFIAPLPDAEIAKEDADDPACQEEFENSIEPGTGEDDDSGAKDATTVRRFLPTSIGMTAILPKDAKTFEAVVDWGDYKVEPPMPELVLDGKEAAKGDYDWVRVPRNERLTIEIKPGRQNLIIPDSASLQRKGGGLELRIVCRPTKLPHPGAVASDGWAISVFVVNNRSVTRNRSFADLSYAFQVRLTLKSDVPFEPNVDLTGYGVDEKDLRINDLHYRDVASYGSGHNTATDYLTEGGVVRTIWTQPIPQAEVEKVAPNLGIKGVEFRMEELARLANSGGTAIGDALEPFPKLYADWISGQEGQLSNFDGVPARKSTAEEIVADQKQACARIAAGIDLLRTNRFARQAFEAMNEAVSKAARRRFAAEAGKSPDEVGAPAWRPFQLAFVLLNLVGLTDKTDGDREIVDLLFFPTGGGKTEAYLGLAAYMIALRRLQGSGVLGAGLSVIMRYTLRLLTLDQLGRAAGVVCALELMRKDARWTDEKGQRLLGDWPIEIGLWIGSKASPNILGGRGNTGDKTAVTRVRTYRRDKREAPAPIKNCPWCGEAFKPSSFDCVPNMHAPTRMEIRCVNTDCEFSGEDPLPILAVDEEIYVRLPAFLIATVDKFAALPWIGETGAFFGHVDRFDPDRGFFGAGTPGQGNRLPNGWSLDPPDLIIQDELHLISGPLGTVAGLYETVIDGLSIRTVEGQPVRPKIVASTATVRRADSQIKALFNRRETAMFPPPGISRDDSFFAVTRTSEEEPARLYLGLAALGRGPRLVFLRAMTTLAAYAKTAYGANAGSAPNPADPYMTSLCYFNALRELGGSRRIVEDEVRDRVFRYGAQRQRKHPVGAPFTDRRLGEPVELTSRISTDQVADAKKRLETNYGEDRAVDTALATNMISVGLDITRLGLMVVQGQPKTSAEYIQATSRVGRDSKRPGLVVTLLNVHKPRDRAHYEQFTHFHQSFYRAVEATSVTPWAARALDRALAAIVVAIGRHIDEVMSPEPSAADLGNSSYAKKQIVDLIVDRASPILQAHGLDNLRRNVEKLIDDWISVADDLTANGGNFVYSYRANGARLLHTPLDPTIGNLDARHQQFQAGQSMRDVEPTIGLRVRDPWNNEIRSAGDLT